MRPQRTTSNAILHQLALWLPRPVYPVGRHTRLLETTPLQSTVSPMLSSGLARIHADGRLQRPLLERPSQTVCMAFTGSIRWRRRLEMSRTSSHLIRSHLGSKFRTAGFPGTSQYSVCWDTRRAKRVHSSGECHSFPIHGGERWERGASTSDEHTYTRAHTGSSLGVHSCPNPGSR